MAIPQQQVPCAHRDCRKVVWRHESCRAGVLRFCSPDCRRAHQKQAEREAADDALRFIHSAYGDGVLVGLGGTSDSIEGPSHARDQFYRGLRDGRVLRILPEQTCPS